ncbi:MAG TPA: putative toxin-antitoxin system toxin component, PIN family [Vicinamibacterales bacterium]
MRVFIGTNVLASAFATRGLCADVLRHVMVEHELLVGEMVLDELRRVLRNKFRLPAALIGDIEELLRDHEVVPKPTRAGSINVRDPDDRWIVASALAGHADVLVTGDRDLLDVADTLPLPVVDPRGFWNLLRKSGASAE